MLQKKDNFFLILLTLLPLFFLGDTLIGSNVFFMRDLTYLFHPWRQFLADSLVRGNFPFWNPYAMGGMPAFASPQNATLYPPTLFFVLWGFSAGLKIFHFLHYALAGVGFYLLSRKLHWSQGPALLAAVLFAFNGYALTRLEFLSALGSLVWFPWITIFFLSAQENGVFFNASCAAIASAFAFYSGYTQIFLIAAFIVSCVFFCLNRDLLKTKIQVMVLFILLFFLLIAGQYLATLELFQHSIRAGRGVNYEESALYSLPLRGLLGLFWPKALPLHADQFTGEKFFWIWSGWIGISGGTLLLFSLLAWCKRIVWIALSALTFSVLWSLGQHTPLYPWVFQHIEWSRIFRYPPVLLYAFIIGCALLVGAGIHAFEKKFLTQTKLKTAVFAIIFILFSAELFWHAKNLQPTIAPDYYTFKRPLIAAIQQDNPSTVFLSPNLDRTRLLAGMSDTLARLEFRSYLFDLTNLPYHLNTLVVCGEPLMLSSFWSYYRFILANKSIEEAEPWLRFAGVSHFITNDATLQSPWKKIFQDQQTFVYKNTEALPFFSIFEDSIEQVFTSKKFQAATALSNRPENFILTLDLAAAKKTEVIVMSHIPFYPGWKIYIATKKNQTPQWVPAFPLNGFFSAVQIPVETTRIWWFYFPHKIFGGILLTVLGCLLIGIVAYQKVQHALRTSI